LHTCIYAKDLLKYHAEGATERIRVGGSRQDVHRTLPTNRYFQSQDAPAIPRLRRILTAYSWFATAPMVFIVVEVSPLTHPVLLLTECVLSGATRWSGTARA